MFEEGNTLKEEDRKDTREKAFETHKHIMSAFVPMSTDKSTERFDLESTNSGTIIISVVENRAREVCLCKINSKQTSTLDIFITVDSHSYTDVLGLIEDCCPHEILLHDGFKSTTLSYKIQETFSHCCSIFFISRQYFDQDKGADLLASIIVGTVDRDLIARYTVLASAYCLIRYIENCSGSAFGPHSVRIEYHTANTNRMAIDRRTAINLELIRNRRTGSLKESLFGCIDHTKTTAGAALLRKTILSPCTDLCTIKMRHDVVELFLTFNQVYADVAMILPKFPDFERMISGLVLTPKTITQKTVRIGIDTLIYLKCTLRTIPLLAESLETLLNQIQNYSDCQAVNGAILLQSIIANLRDESLSRIKEKIEILLTDSTKFTKNSHEMRHQECFAIRPNTVPYLDVARKTFLQSVEDIHDGLFVTLYAFMLSWQRLLLLFVI